MQEPHHEQKRRGLHAALQHAGQLPALATKSLQGSFPQPVVFGNRLQGDKAKAFARQAIQEAVSAGVVVRWPFVHRRPWVVLPLAVAENSSGKQRLILDARYVNWFLQYLPFEYERLQDISAYEVDGMAMATDDQKAGYHHVYMAPESWGLLGAELDGQMYVFACLPFGLSQAPWAFTKLMRAVLALPRAYNWNVVSVIDDSGIVGEHNTVVSQSWALAWLKAALGFVHSREKCVFWPAHRVRLLGFIVDMQRRQFEVPQDKLQRFLAGVAELKRSHNPSLLNSLRGQLASFALAIPMSPLLGRWLQRHRMTELKAHTQRMKHGVWDSLSSGQNTSVV
jgi:hypothetical protein